MSAEDDWTQDEQQKLEEGLLKSVSIVDQREKWKAIALVVGSRNAKACATRFQACRMLARNAGAQASPEESPEASEAEEEEEGRNGDAADEETPSAPSNGRPAAANWSSGPRDETGGWWNSRGGWNESPSSNTNARTGRGRGRVWGSGAVDADRWWEGRDWRSVGADEHQGWSAGWEESKVAEEGNGAWETAKESVAQDEQEPLDEDQKRALDMKKEVEANRARMRQRQERLQQEEARKDAKKTTEIEEKRQKMREHAEAKDKEFQEAVERKKALHEQDRQRELEAKREAERTDISFFADRRSPVVGKAKASVPARGGWAAKAGTTKGQMQKQRKEEEMERQAAEVRANLGLPKVGGTIANGSNSSSEDEEPPEATPALSPPRPNRQPVGPQLRASKPPQVAETPFDGNSSNAGPRKGMAGGKQDKKGKGGKEGKGGKDGEKGKGPRWWERIESSIICPISLAPICELPRAPFALEAAGSTAIHYFDARFLANFLLSSCDFIDPVNRRTLAHEECVALDEHLQRNHPDNAAISVADAFALFEINGRGGAAAGDNQVQREATAVLQHLFRFQSSRRTDRTGRAINYAEGGLTVVDDDDILTAPAPLPAREQGAATEGGEFPELPGGATAASPGIASGSWNGRQAAGYPTAEAFPGLPPASAKPKGAAKAKAGAAPKANTKAGVSRGGAAGRGKQPPKPKAWAKPGNF